MANSEQVQTETSKEKIIYMESSPLEKAPSKKEIVIASVPLLVVCVVAFVFFLIARDGGLEARVVEIMNVDGQDVRIIAYGVGEPLWASAGIRLNDGYRVSTGVNSYSQIRLGVDSYMRMDSNSMIFVNRPIAETLSIVVGYGNVLFDMQNQYPGQEVEILAGHFSIGVQDALFIAGCWGNIVYVMVLEGRVYVEDELYVTAGHVMAQQGDEPFEVLPLCVEHMEPFLLQVILDYGERVLEAGAVAEEDLDWIIRRMNILDYIWIQGVRISTSITELHIVAPSLMPFSLRFLENVFELYLTNEDVELLTHMINLEALTLIAPSIYNISSIAGLTNLRMLNIHRSQLSDISPLSNLERLYELNLSRNQINDISPLSGLVQLSSLNLNSNQINDISPLSGLVQLSSLWLFSNQINDIAPLSNITSLTYLGLFNNQISDISALAGLTNLTRLWLDFNQISDISALAELTNLTYLHLSFNQISDISPLAGLTNLTSLWLRFNQISDWTPVDHLVPVPGRP